jgi:raffinose/stachyose/melibiose transport system substrate-binding protein
MRKTVLLAVSAALIAGIFPGCQKSGQANAQSDQAKLVYWSMWNEAEPQGQVIARAAEAFTQETGIELTVNFNGRDIRKTLQPALDAGEAVDIFDEDVERVNNAWGSYLLPLDQYINQVYPTTDGKPYNEVVSKTLMNLVKDLGGGVTKSIPYQPFAFVTMYNKDLFRQAGITSLPKDWAEFIAVCEKLKAAGITPLTVDDAYMAAFFGYCMDRLAGKDAALAMAKNNDFSGPQVLEFGRIFEDMAKQGYMSKNAASNIWPAGQLEEIAAGKAAMYLNGTWLPNEIKGSAPNMNWGSFAWPAMGNGDGPETNNFGGQCFGINKNTKYPKEAVQWAVYMTTGRWDVELAAESLGIPMADDSAWPPALAEAKVIVDNTTVRLPWGAGMEDNPDINAKIKENFAKLILGSINAQQFADNMKK